MHQPLIRTRREFLRAAALTAGALLASGAAAQASPTMSRRMIGMCQRSRSSTVVTPAVSGTGTSAPRWAGPAASAAATRSSASASAAEMTRHALWSNTGRFGNSRHAWRSATRTASYVAIVAGFSRYATDVGYSTRTTGG